VLVLAIEGLGAEELGYKLGFLKFLSLSEQHNSKQEYFYEFSQ